MVNLKVGEGSINRFILLGILIVLSAFFASSESALFSLGPFRIRRLRSYTRKSFQAAQKLLERPTRLISTLLIGNEIVNAAISIVGSSLVYSLFRHRIDNPAWLPFLAIAIVLPFVLIFCEIIPKTLGLKLTERVAAFNARPLLWFSQMVQPVRDLLVWIPEKILKLFGKSVTDKETVSEEVFRSMVDLGMQEGILDAQERRLIHNVFRLDDIQVSSIMTYQESVSHVWNNSTIGQCMRHFEAERFSRYPVLNRDNQKVTGVLYAKDLLAPEPLPEDQPIENYVRPALLVSPQATALDLFAQFRSRRTHFAVVVNLDTQEMLGVVTLEDVLEEIFGDIQDERDVEEGGKSKLLSS